MAKTYSSKQLAAIITWCSGSKLIKFLESNGIQPVRQVQFSNRTYREYDAAALTKCQELRAAHDAAKAAPKPSATPSGPTPSEAAEMLHTLHTLLKTSQLLIQAVGDIQAKLADLALKVTDTSTAVQDLAKNQPVVEFDDDAHVGHFDLSAPAEAA